MMGSEILAKNLEMSILSSRERWRAEKLVAFCATFETFWVILIYCDHHHFTITYH